MTTAAQAMVSATAKLRAAGVPDPARDARVLLAHAAQVEAARITLLAPEDLTPEIAERFEHLISLRSVRIPVSHLVGARDFYGRRFQISHEVLDPRPETETLIEAALADPFATLLDLGTGSGVILVTLLAEAPGAVGMGVDISKAACLQASANAVQHQVAARADIRQSDWFSDVEGQFDLILCNPPYLAAEEMAHVAPELRDHEPHLALTDGGDGLSVYRILAQEAARFLEPGGRLLLEIGWRQARAVTEILTQAGWWDLCVMQDLDGRDRVICAKQPR